MHTPASGYLAVIYIYYAQRIHACIYYIYIYAFLVLYRLSIVENLRRSNLAHETQERRREHLSESPSEVWGWVGDEGWKGWRFIGERWNRRNCGWCRKRVGSQVSLMRPSLKPRNLAISTGDLFCSDGVETMQEENNKRIERITKKRKKEKKQTNNICTRKKVTTEKKSMRIAISDWVRSHGQKTFGANRS